MQSLKHQQQCKPTTNRMYHTPVARVSPLMKNQQTDYQTKEQSWLSCEELETIEKRFTDLLHEISNKKSTDYQQYEQRAKSCDRLIIDEPISKPTSLSSKFLL